MFEVFKISGNLKNHGYLKNLFFFEYSENFENLKNPPYWPNIFEFKTFRKSAALASSAS